MMMPGLGMGDRGLVVLAAAIALLGLIFLYYYGQQIQPRQIDFSDLESQPLNSYVEVVGSIRGVTSKSGSLLITFCDFADCITVFMPSSAADAMRLNPYLLKSGDRVVVRGRMQEYKGERELVPAGENGIEFV